MAHMTRTFFSRVALLLAISVFPGLLVCLSATGPQTKKPDGVSEKQVKRWIDDLGSADFQTREAATRALMELQDEPRHLRDSLKSPDLEVRHRLTRILEAYVPKRARRGLAKAQVLAKEGRVDEMVERLVLWNEWDRGKERGKLVGELAARMIEWEYRTFGKTGFLTHIFGSPGLAVRPPKFLVTPEVLIETWSRPKKELRGIDVTEEFDPPRQSINAVIVASRDARVGMLETGVIVAGGDVRLIGASASVIICAGNIELGSLTDCLVIAGGNVKCPRRLGGCTILSGGSIMVSREAEFKGCALLCTGNPDFPAPKSPVKFFNPTTVGLTVWQLYGNGKAWPDGMRFTDREGRPVYGDGVWIKELRKDSPFAAGLRAEDVITAIDEKKTPSKAIFRKLLRRKLAEGGPTITFTVRRAGKTVDVPIAIKD
jgi:hypothetical protein